MFYIQYLLYFTFIYGIGKDVPLHATEAHGGRGGIAPTHT
jgi:hypothetical protein